MPASASGIDRHVLLVLSLARRVALLLALFHEGQECAG